MITGTYNLTVNPQWINVQQQEVFLECDTTLAPVTINLFEIVELNRFWGVKIIISDANNNAGTNNITVNASGSDTVDDDTTNQIVINTNGSSVSFQVASETQWLAIESIVAVATAPYKVYTALLSQTGIDAPVATVLENTLDEDITYQYNGAGNYSILTPNNTFTANKTYSVLQLWADDGVSPRLGFIGWASTNELYLTLTDPNGIPADTLGNNSSPVYFLTSIEIRVYN